MLYFTVIPRLSWQPSEGRASCIECNPAILVLQPHSKKYATDKVNTNAKSETAATKYIEHCRIELIEELAMKTRDHNYFIPRERRKLI